MCKLRVEERTFTYSTVFVSSRKKMRVLINHRLLELRTCSDFQGDDYEDRTPREFRRMAAHGGNKRDRRGCTQWELWVPGPGLLLFIIIIISNPHPKTCSLRERGRG